MTERQFDELITSKLAKPVSVAIQPERAAYAFREDAEHLVVLEHPVCILLACDHAAELHVKIEEKGKLDESRMNQKSDIAPKLPSDEVQHHDCVPRHKTTMDANQHGAPRARHVVKSLDFDTPVSIM